MWAGFDILTDNLAMSFPDIVLLIVVIGSLVFYAKDTKLGILMTFIMTSACSMWFYASGMDYSKSIIVSFIALVLLTITLYSSKTAAPNELI